MPAGTVKSSRTFQDHGFVEFANVWIAAAGEGGRARVRFIEGHGVGAPDRGDAVRTDRRS